MEFERALVVFAHPDDAEFLCGGTIAKWVAQGTDVRYVCASDGSAGWNGPDRDRGAIADTRKREMADAANVLGVSDVRFLDFVDGSLEANLDLRRAVTREVRRAQPDVLVTFDPTQRWSGRGYISHPDHLAVGEAVLAVIACDAPTRPQFPELIDEGFEPFKVRALWLASEAGDKKIDIADTIGKKIEAVMAHRSQIENMGDFDVETRLREWAARTARDEETMELAESFRTFALED